MSPLDALDRAIDAYGAGVGGFAKKIGSRQSTVSNWRARLQSGEQVVIPAEYCPAIERLVGVPCEDLNPNVDWAYIRRTASLPA